MLETVALQPDTAAVAYQAATLAARHAGLWISGAHVFVGALQLAAVIYGIRAMRFAGDKRAREQDQRHAENMTALKALIERTGRAPAR